MPGPGVTQAELNHLRGAIVASLQSGQPETDIGAALIDQFASASDTLSQYQDAQADLEYLATQAGAVSANVRIARRSTPLRLAFDEQAAPAWTVGLEPARSFGPFIDN